MTSLEPVNPDSSATARNAVLKVEDLVVEAATREGSMTIVDGLSLTIKPGETLGLVGESGSGKSMTALAIMRLLGAGARITTGRVVIQGTDVLSLSDEQMRRMRGNRVGMVFQEPMTALDPAYTVGEQIAEGVRAHLGSSRRQAWARAVEMLDRVGIPSAATRAKDYPHHFSGGMRQRVVIAIALACEPALLLADEPTTALDVTVQDQILGLLKEIQVEQELAILFISHDLGVIADICDRVDVMYAGQVIESGSVENLFARTDHPYTEALLRSIPSGPDRRLIPIPGVVPTFDRMPLGCRFEPRCTMSQDSCRQQPVTLRRTFRGHAARCLFPASERTVEIK